MVNESTVNAPEKDSSRAGRNRWAWFRNRVLPWIGLGMGLLCLVAGLTLLIGPKRPKQYRLTISAGSQTGLRSRFIELLTSRFPSEGEFNESPTLNLELIAKSSEGSLDALRQVEAGELELAFVQGGLPTGEYESVRQVASLHLEPLHLLVGPQSYTDVSEHLGGLRGKRINVSSPGSGTYLLSKQVLRFAKLKPDDYLESNLGYSELIRDAESDRGLPEAVFLVSSLPSPVAQKLISERGYRLVPLPLSALLRRTWLGEYGDASDEAQHDIARALRRIDHFEIPAMTYQIDPPRPTKTIETIGTRLNLVANQDVAEEVVAYLAATVYETDFARATEQRLRWDELNELAEFPLHTGVQTYLAGKQPLATGQVIEVTEQLVGILGALVGAWLFLWQWLSRMRMRRKDAEFVGCIDRVVKIENEALTYEDDEHVPIEKLQNMQEELSEIKTTLINRYRDGYLEGTEMLSAFLKHANDASELISRIILHKMGS